ncbi:hypothetical protein Mal64_14440 [Pseudobythopirellula maris]|uniref:DUF6298 domain-containing protein n=1 Tax=Pseudobythopirellula maris TaxID=2527991 RepID=A0A5C5ZV99_9BACT|nr:DUF6298 domain-containing protein [Pseudobythopirellula maris]TWT91045.1 hypothetical protein Mal64_14440 [Pseudobythopirellula maris]
MPDTSPLRSLAHSLLLLAVCASLLSAQQPPLRMDHGRLQYNAAENGDRVPDFSNCGYAGADRDIPQATTVLVVEADGEDSTRLIQGAIDRVSSMPLGDDGLCGAVLLLGEHRVSGQLRIAASGVVLRGAGSGSKIIATGPSRRPLVRIEPLDPGRAETGEPAQVVDERAPVGATVLTLSAGHGLEQGDRVLITRPSTDEWIAALSAKAHGVGWRAGRTDIRWERTVVAVDGDRVTLDAPITTAIEQRFGGATVARLATPGRLSNVGVEDLELVSEVEGDNPKDEDHSWHGVVANHAEDLWVRRVRFTGFAGGAVLLREAVARSTVEDCVSLAPVSELGGYRRQSFFTQGQQTLFLRCWAEHGLHDFSVGHCAPGPNAFVNCYASETNGDSGPLESWASGVLYDNVRIDGGDLKLTNRWVVPPGAGWSAANCLAWQCQAAQIHCFTPPTAQNWVIGYWSQTIGDGVFHGESEYWRPISIYRQQLGERLGEGARDRAGTFLLNPIASTNPSYEQAQRFSAQSSEPNRTLRDLIEDQIAEASSQGSSSTSSLFFGRKDLPAAEQTTPAKPVKIVNGWLTAGGEVITGASLAPTWWRGTIRPADAPGFGPSVSRYAPGRYGMGLTDELVPTADRLAERGFASYEHHYGLWYDRRRDDHLMVRRATGDVAPPFYEQPFARSGQGTAWDGLSRYDLTKPNPWYWRRLNTFAELLERRGMTFFSQSFFQHNILEAGGHWVDCPWRPTNNINGTDLTEPPPFVGDKRIFIAQQFYSPETKALRQLQSVYLRQCVDTFADRSNVIHATSAEYTGPQEFAEFWLDTVRARIDETRAGGMVALSTTKDVQDAILADPERAGAVDIIDIRYWSYGRGDKVYAPPGGANLAPRQHSRKGGGGGGGFESVARSVRDYRTRHPEKPVLYSAGGGRSSQTGWAVLMGGGSLANTPPLPAELKKAIVAMRPEWEEGDTVLRLADDEGGQLCYAVDDDAQITLNDTSSVRWIDPESGKVLGKDEVEGTVELRGRVAWITPH